MIATDETSTAVIGYADGRRYELAPRSLARLSVGDLEPLAGEIATLPTLGTAALVLELADSEAAGTRVAAVRLRGDPSLSSELALRPLPGERVLADATILRFAAPPELPTWQLTVRDLQGTVLWASETRGTTAVPPGVLSPGRRYLWEIATSTPDLGELIATGELETLDGPTTVARQSLVREVEQLGDRSAAVLLHALDRRLGLDPCAGAARGGEPMAHSRPHFPGCLPQSGEEG